MHFVILLYNYLKLDLYTNVNLLYNYQKTKVDLFFAQVLNAQQDQQAES